MRLAEIRRLSSFSLVLLLVGMVGAGCGAAVTSRHGRADASSPTSASVLSAVYAGMTNAVISDPTIISPPQGLQAGSGQVWVAVVLPADATPGAGFNPADTVRAGWEAMMLMGAYNAKASAVGLATAAGVRETYANGTFSGDDSITPAAVTGTPISSQSQAVAQIDQGLAAAGLTPISITFELPDLMAPVVIARTSDPQAFMNNRKSDDIFGDMAYEGALLEVQDSSGNLVFAWGDSPRTQGVVSWVAPAYRTGGGLVSP